ncbi:hypothetical protein THASP1DRAFT_30240 [Thamnocephalis sphaerospora]|uniref:SCP domain-containing protein n=1 Tax=Thamnocephalis sphaerospora TaxID=78915 RepID=A0A4P9XR07_9FUNG|nr:hypothetical protein THASP1DRAFT_30240 [Thamnocephalis sphaerospora]|eukprot:RKP07941.1 hypothetical protein THASP1DRAFT_30240 [Thamnocephalis sphaerospora]
MKVTMATTRFAVAGALLCLLSVFNGGLPGVDAYNRQRLLCLVNSERAKMGLSPLQEDTVLTTAAQERCAERARARLTKPTESEAALLKTINDNGYKKWVTVGQAVATGAPDEAASVKKWLEDTDSRKSMLNPKYTKWGGTVVYDNSGTPYWTGIFGNDGLPPRGGKVDPCPVGQDTPVPGEPPRPSTPSGALSDGSDAPRSAPLPTVLPPAAPAPSPLPLPLPQKPPATTPRPAPPAPPQPAPPASPQPAPPASPQPAYPEYSQPAPPAYPQPASDQPAAPVTPPPTPKSKECEKPLLTGSVTYSGELPLVPSSKPYGGTGTSVNSPPSDAPSDLPSKPPSGGQLSSGGSSPDGNGRKPYGSRRPPASNAYPSGDAMPSRADTLPTSKSVRPVITAKEATRLCPVHVSRAGRPTLGLSSTRLYMTRWR